VESYHYHPGLPEKPEISEVDVCSLASVSPTLLQYDELRQFTGRIKFVGVVLFCLNSSKTFYIQMQFIK
jgi:hypothetical protein